MGLEVEEEGNNFETLPEFAIVGSRPSAAGTAMAALKFWTLNAVLKIAI